MRKPIESPSALLDQSLRQLVGQAVADQIGALADALIARLPKPEAPAPVTRMITVDQAAERVGVDRSTLWKWERAGKFPKRHRLPSNQARYIEADVEAWILSCPEGMA
jgi:predicted DNA-binding transcriptional regulator AlpA